MTESKEQTPRRLAVDIGSVVRSDWSEPVVVADLPVIEDCALNEFRRLTNIFGGETHVTAVATDAEETRIRAWLKDQDFYEKTGMSPDNLHVERGVAALQEVCTDIEVGYYVDDRLQGLQAIGSATYLYLYLYLPGRDGSRGIGAPWATDAKNWQHLKNVIQRDLDHEIAGTVDRRHLEFNLSLRDEPFFTVSSTTGIFLDDTQPHSL